MVKQGGSLEPIISISLVYTVKKAALTEDSGNDKYEPTLIVIILATLVLVAGAGYVYNRDLGRRSRTVYLEAIGDLLAVIVVNAHLPPVVILGYHKVSGQGHLALLRSMLNILLVASYVKH